MGRPRKVKTPEEIAIEKEKARLRSNQWHKEWRRNNPDRQALIMERFWKKKAAQMGANFTEDLEKIKAELSQ